MLLRRQSTAAQHTALRQLSPRSCPSRHRAAQSNSSEPAREPHICQSTRSYPEGACEGGGGLLGSGSLRADVARIGQAWRGQLLVPSNPGGPESPVAHIGQPEAPRLLESDKLRAVSCLSRATRAPRTERLLTSDNQRAGSCSNRTSMAWSVACSEQPGRSRVAGCSHRTTRGPAVARIGQAPRGKLPASGNTMQPARPSPKLTCCALNPATVPR